MISNSIPKQLRLSVTESINFNWEQSGGLLLFSTQRPILEKTKRLSIKNSSINQLKWDSLILSSTRKFYSQSHGIFLSLQKLSAKLKLEKKQKQSTILNLQLNLNLNERLNKFQSDLVLISRQYRAVLTEYLVSLSQKSKRDPNLVDEANLIGLAVMLWHLCEIIFIDQTVYVTAREPLSNWYLYHFSMNNNSLRQNIFQTNNSRNDKKNKKIQKQNKLMKKQNLNKIDLIQVLQSALVGDFEQVFFFIEQELSEIKKSPNVNKSLIKIIKFIKSELSSCPRDFEISNTSDSVERLKKWQRECQQKIERLPEFNISYDNSISLLIKNWKELLMIFAGDFDVIRQYSQNWIEFLIANVLWIKPNLTIKELPLLVEQCRKEFINTEDTPTNEIIMMILKNSPIKVIRMIETLIASPWLSAHLIDLLYHSKIIDSQKITYNGLDLREHYLIEFCQRLINCNDMFITTSSYLKQCKTVGRSYIELFLKREKINSDNYAKKLINICNKNDLYKSADRIKNTRAIQLLQTNNNVQALIWLISIDPIRRKNVLINRTVDKILKNANDLSDLDILVNSISSVINEKNSSYQSDLFNYLSKYSKITHLFEKGQLQKGAQIIVKLIETRTLPKQFWLTILNDIAKLISLQDEIIFDKHGTFVIMNFLEQITTFEHERETLLSIDNSQIQKIRFLLVKNLGKSLIY
ncbi:frount protein-related [Anaeramoeba flamelloides]|uniref:Nuclear pore complex protein Nup85 n=1 Tax=Anaeramoeba flamelloides TaxID=1746091 RepID=A0AAV8AAD4_9EUKA|nr:frount protein-related [Anaeramoeba flamelloides]